MCMHLNTPNNRASKFTEQGEKDSLTKIRIWNFDMFFLIIDRTSIQRTSKYI